MSLAYLATATIVCAERTRGELERVLTQAGAECITFERAHGQVSAISFRLGGQFYRQVANTDGVLKRLIADKRTPKRFT